MPKCKYEYEYESSPLENIPPEIPLDCREQPTENGEFCIFHDKNYFEGHEQEAARRFEQKVRKSISKNEPLVCFGCYLPGINFANLLEGKSFAQPVYFNNATFSKEAISGDATFTEGVYFGSARFFEGAYFEGAKFLDEVYFQDNKFTGETFFRDVTFEQQNKVKFDDNNLSNVSFAESDITRIKFGDEIRWGVGKKAFTIIDEEWLTDKGRKENDFKNVSLELVLSVYRNLRENYEFRLRYDDAGKFFIKEMELKRKYRHVSSKYELKLIVLHRKLKRDKSPLPKAGELIENGWFRRQFSLTGLYYHLSRYGESISRPILIGAITVFLSTLFWVTQSNPILEPNSTNSTFVGFSKTGEPGQWLKAFERSFADFLPLLPAGDFKVGIIDFIIKIVGGALTFGLLLIAFRRKFERKYTR